MSRLARLFWEALDRVDYAVMLARCWALDLIYGPEPTTPADRQREAGHERLREAFPDVDFDETVAPEEEQYSQPRATLTTPLTAPDEAPPPPAESAHRPGP